MPATPEITRKRKADGKRDMRRTPGGSPATKGEPGGGPCGGDSSSSYQPTSTPSDLPSKPSKARWQKPHTVREFAAQANMIATMVLNGEIDMEVAKGYATLARVVAQSASIEVTRARFLKREPDLSLD